ncbi:MAG: bifunctional (p)ppGpp synthetase/guanosine-3',5'-bis(diphosphate) 3'-pyrophosphohydrolase [Deltaproteobacteria bacterium]|nr:bifunctional (p)ppGpp synthetase/guanosine-3',5'-bis(diphosphate) 3'-pyrophosphohydrolase [Deltaproteobacteria bacterium]
MNLLKGLLEEVHQVHPTFPLEPIEQAYHLATKCHGDQTRKSGEPYIIHPVEVVRILLKMNLDLPSLLAGILHDTVEDTFLSLADIERDFGKEVAFLVDGVTKLSKLSFHSKHQAQAENFRKMILAMGKDIRVILIKLADRLHNMRTLQFMNPEKQIEISEETIEIYAPLAHRLGIHWIKTELEDLCLRYQKPDVYFKLVQLVSKSRKSREKYIEDVLALLKDEMHKVGFVNYEITGRPKNFYSIYKKMEKSAVSFEQVHDLIAFRIVCEDIRGCYQALGLVHSMWKPVPGRFKDYIAMPKANLYQSLHTTIVGPLGERMEIQIRTKEMHDIAELGIAAHWTYKKDGSVEQKDIQKFSWIRKLVEDQEDVKDSSEFLKTLKIDLFEEEVFVFTPKGDVFALPKGACPVDFAYAIHSKVGDSCVGAKVNGRIVPLREKLKSGDEVEIITSEAQSPRKDWLDFIVTSRARSKIRGLVKKEQRERARELGTKLLEREFRRAKLNLTKLSKDKRLEELAPKAGASGEEDLLIKIGYGKLLALDVAKIYAKELGVDGIDEDSDAGIEDSKDDKETTFIQKMFKKAREKKGAAPVRVQGMDHMLIRFAKCCNPIPGEPIIGFVSRGRGISVHSSNCEKSLAFDPARKVEIDWVAGETEEFRAGIRVSAEDQPGILAQVTKAISNLEGNITQANVATTRDKKAVISLEVVVKNLPQLHTLIKNIEKISGVITAERSRI